MNIITTVSDFFTNLLKPKAPKVACPRCKELHEINIESKCPNCGLKYKLPDEYRKYIPTNTSATAAPKKEAPAPTPRFKSHRPSVEEALEMRDKALMETAKKQRQKKSGRIIKLSISVVIISLVFFVFSLVFFKDKDALLFKVGEYKNQPVFYVTEDAKLRCAFPNNKGALVGKGTIHSYLSSSDGKNVYLTYTGAFGSDEISNYVLRITKFGDKIEKIAEDKVYVPKIAAGGDNKYLYIMIPTDATETIFKLSVSEDGKAPKKISDKAREIAVSTSGRYVLLSENDSGASKLMIYNAPKKELINPGIKNAHPLSIDNKGEYMIYARKNTPETTDIISEKLNEKRVEIPVFNQTKLNSIIFAQDRRSFAMSYSDRTVFYTCGEDDYIISNTDGDSVFGYDFNNNVCHNIFSFVEIPQIINVHGTDLLPFFYYDREHKFIYRVTDKGAKESVFDTHVIDQLKVSENNRVAFVSGGILYTGKLDKKNNDLCEIMNFNNKQLVAITPDGKLVCYTDSDGKMFTTEYGKKNKSPKQITVDPDIVRYASDGKSLLSVSGDKTVLINKKGKSKDICKNIIPSMTVIADKDLSEFFYTVSYKDKNSGAEKKKLYLYRKGKSKLITEELSDLCLIDQELRLDITKSSYINISDDSSDGQAATQEGGDPAVISPDGSAAPTVSGTTDPNTATGTVAPVETVPVETVPAA